MPERVLLPDKDPSTIARSFAHQLNSNIVANASTVAAQEIITFLGTTERDSEKEVYTRLLLTFFWYLHSVFPDEIAVSREIVKQLSQILIGSTGIQAPLYSGRLKVPDNFWNDFILACRLDRRHPIDPRDREVVKRIISFFLEAEKDNFPHKAWQEAMAAGFFRL